MAIIDQFKEAIVLLLRMNNLDISTDMIELPKDSRYGDFAVPCFSFAKEMKKSPAAIALEITQACEKTKDPLIDEVKNVGPYINFFINKHILAEKLLSEINKKKIYFAHIDAKTNKQKQRVMVEFCSPNTNKPLHLGHIRNMLLGESVSDILKFNGNDVIKSCLVNDRGMHICKSMIAYDLWGEGKTPKTAKKKGDHFVGDFYVEYAKHEDDELKEMVQDWLKKWEHSDPKIMKLWKTMNEWVYEGFDTTFKRLGISFDKFYYESKMYDKGKEIVEEGLKKNIFMKKDGAIYAPLATYNLPDKVLLRSDGTTVYMTQDIYLAIKKLKDYKLDSSIYVVGSEQNMHFQQLFAILEMLGYEQAKKMHHMSYGMVNLPDGKMKSREGTVVDADDLLDDLIDIAKIEVKKRETGLLPSVVTKRATTIALAGLKFYMLKQDPAKEMTYNPKESLSFEGETGPYVQYSAVRIKSIIDKSGKKIPKTVDFNRMEPAELNVAMKLSQFEDIIAKTGEQKKPSLLCNYLIELSQEFNSYYHSTKIIDTGMEAERLYLINAVRTILVSGLKLLGIDVPEKM